MPSEQYVPTIDPDTAQQTLTGSVDSVSYEDVRTILGAPLSVIDAEDRPHALRRAQIPAYCLTLEGVEVLVGYPGGANLEIFDVLQGCGIRCVGVEYEQGAVHAAERYPLVR